MMTKERAAMVARVMRKIGKGRCSIKWIFLILLIFLILPAITFSESTIGDYAKTFDSNPNDAGAFLGGGHAYYREPAPNQVEMPGGGRQIEITGATDVSFSPKESALWLIFTNNCGSGDPVLELYDSNGFLIKSDDDSYGDGNAMIFMHLSAGQMYRICIGFKGDGGENCIFRIFSPVEMPGGGIEEVIGWGVFSFTPDRSGTWHLRTISSDRNVDPYIRIYDVGGNIIAEDDNSGDGYNASVTIDLVAGETYGIFMSSCGSGRRDFVIAVAGG